MIYAGHFPPLSVRGGVFLGMQVTMTDDPKPETRGGAGRNQGRKPIGTEPRRRVSITVDVEIDQYIRETGGSLSMVSEEAIRRSRAFREWKRKRNAG